MKKIKSLVIEKKKRKNNMYNFNVTGFSRNQSTTTRPQQANLRKNAPSFQGGPEFDKLIGRMNDLTEEIKEMENNGAAIQQCTEMNDNTRFFSARYDLEFATQKIKDAMKSSPYKTAIRKKDEEREAAQRAKDESYRATEDSARVSQQRRDLERYSAENGRAIRRNTAEVAQEIANRKTEMRSR